jgi:hypothetical protein
VSSGIATKNRGDDTKSYSMIDAEEIDAGVLFYRLRDGRETRLPTNI